MSRFIVLLRGINVGGKRPLKMADLRTLLEEADFQDVKTYIQSGNIVLSSSQERTDVEEAIKQLIHEKYEYDIPVLALSEDELKDLINHNPYADNHDIKFLHVTMLQAEVDKLLIEKLLETTDEEVTHHGRCLYMVCPNGYHKSKLTNNKIERALRTKATTRNWKTMSKLMEMLSPSEGE